MKRAIVLGVGVAILLTGCAGTSGGAPLTKDEACSEIQSWAADNPSPDLDPGSSESMRGLSAYFTSIADEMKSISSRVKDNDALFAGIMNDAAEPNIAASQAAQQLADGDTSKFSDFTSAVQDATSQIDNINGACGR